MFSSLVCNVTKYFDVIAASQDVFLMFSVFWTEVGLKEFSHWKRGYQLVIFTYSMWFILGIEHLWVKTIHYVKWCGCVTYSPVLFTAVCSLVMCCLVLLIWNVCLSAGGCEGEAEEAGGAADGFDQQLPWAAHQKTSGQEPGCALQHRRHLHRLPDAR